MKTLRPLLIAAGCIVATSAAATPDWAAVTAAFGRDAVEQPGDVHRFNFPRSDLSVTVDGVEVRPGLALGTWFAFAPMGDDAMVMGDMVLTGDEIAAVTTALADAGIDITAIHHHILRAEPMTYYVHVDAMGDAVAIAEGLRAALETTATPLDPPPAAGEQPPPDIDMAGIDAALGRAGEAAGGIYRFSIPRAEAITADGMTVPNALGLGTAINFQPTGNGEAAITGDFVLTADEVNPVIAALRAHGIEVTSLHNHMLDEEPRLFFMHFWAVDNAVTLAEGLRAALDLVNLEAADAGGAAGAGPVFGFTAQQVTQGRGTYGNGCSGCHGETLAGLDGGPPLTGDLFARWFDGPVVDLFTFIHERMPADQPGSLTPRQVAGLVAFLSERNGFTAGDTALPEDPAALAGMVFR
ncbi:MAG: DUF1259 domain-containing protein [Parvibaculaceae bacterium]